MFNEFLAKFKAVTDRNRREYRFLARLTGQTVAEVEADLTAPDPGSSNSTPDLSLIPTSELLQDLRDTENDIVACETGLAIGVTEYSAGESVQHRLDVNRRIRQVIKAELQQRNDSDDPIGGGGGLVPVEEVEF